ncbi:conserved hypothetical protein [Candidatus Nitrotoga sp. HW29]|uniref:hypothetical protein n=1 Tax=Candidatus Nitrotoga sp. HW29 TaxID=2886963 RepID=UPI001EF1EE06|nr:hypothetical protein [Candidatus Nitrotoga sp. HW29]CAH1904605.1 conserved hypothetical protein [Candidatus Nitrotoga sp. HW29]
MRTLLILFIVIWLALLSAIYLSIEKQPLITGTAQFTPAHIGRAKQILSRNDPRRMKSGVLRTITISQEDLDLAVNYLANSYGKGSSNIDLQQGMARVRATVELPSNPIGRYLNIDAKLRETNALPRFEYLHIGKLPVPAFVANWLLQFGIKQLQANKDYGAAADIIKNVSTSDDMLRIVFEWNDALPNQLKALLVPPKEQERLKAYHEQLVELTKKTSSKHSLRLNELMRALFELAAQRTNNGNDPAAENRAAIIVMAFYVNGKGLGAIIPAAIQWPKPTSRIVTLGGRGDFSQHFTISAALAATAGSPLSDVIGLYKEIADSRGGSGFSFNDIAADRAGTRLGELATTSDNGAQNVQQQFNTGLRESDIMPEVKDLPEFMQEIEFKRRYGSIDSPAYIKMSNEIERRIAALPLYR